MKFKKKNMPFEHLIKCYLVIYLIGSISAEKWKRYENVTKTLAIQLYSLCIFLLLFMYSDDNEKWPNYIQSCWRNCETLWEKLNGIKVSHEIWRQPTFDFVCHVMTSGPWTNQLSLPFFKWKIQVICWHYPLDCYDWRTYSQNVIIIEVFRGWRDFFVLKSSSWQWYTGEGGVA